jgi:hypothetical protein
VLVFHQRIDPDSRTGRGSAWVAETIADGVPHSARSRSGAPFELARRLIEAGAPDQQVQVYTDGIKGCMTYRSLAKMAEMTIEESRTVPVRTAKWRNQHDIWGQDARKDGGPISTTPDPSDVHEIAERRPLAAISAK